jgi:hypothetical protein
MRALRSVALACVVVAATFTTGCERTFRDMYDQPKLKPLAASTVFADGRASRPAVEGTVPRAMGTFAGASSGRRQDPLEDLASTPTVTIDDALLARGRERYDIFCAPCHSIVGDGDGMVVRRGFPAPPSFHTDRLRSAPDAHYVDVIVHGYGAMYPYADRVPPRDRVAIVAYIRALQLAQRAPLDRVPPASRAQLDAMATSRNSSVQVPP